MSTTLIIALVGIVVIAAIGFAGNRSRAMRLDQWAVGERRFGAFTLWFLQAGEIFTTFTFLGMAGLAFSGGVSALYAVPYVPLGFMVLFFVGPKLWALGKRRGYLTQADFFTDRFSSPVLGGLAAVLGVVFLLPYLQLQITGLGLVVELVTGNASSGVVSMVVGAVLTAGFVLWSGIRGVASASYFKDALMIVVLAIIVVAVPLHFTGGFGGAFTRLATERPEMLTVHSGQYDWVWFLTSMLVSAIGVGFMGLPHTWPALLSASGPKALRRNYIWLPIYQIAIVLPILVGLVAILVLPKNTDSNAVLLNMVNEALPDWLVGVVAVAAAATAMVPAAGIVLGMSTLVSRNIVRTGDAPRQLSITRITVVVTVALALVLALVRPDLLANLLLLTYSGTVQLAPAFAIGMLRRRIAGAPAVIAGIVAGEIVVCWLTFGEVPVANVNEGLIGLAANLLVLGAVALARRPARAGTEQPADAEHADQRA